jgi:lysophospholipase L1-like esterase
VLLVVVVFLLLALAPAARADPGFAVVVGDSICRDYPDDNFGWDIQGWGHYLAQHLNRDMAWQNDGLGSQSTKSFIAEGHWQAALDAGPTVVFIQFGLADASGQPGLATGPYTDYRANLHQMITDAQHIGALPILVTPPIIRWHVEGSDEIAHPNGLEAYANAMIQQANDDGVPYVDMQAWSDQIGTQLGYTQTQALYGFIIPEGPWPIPGGTPDQLHFSHYGAEQAALMIIDRLRSVAPELMTHLDVQPAPDPLPVPALPGPWWASLDCLALGIASVGRAARRA